MGRWPGMFLGLCIAGCASPAAPRAVSAGEHARLEKLHALAAFSGRCGVDVNAAGAEPNLRRAPTAIDAPPPPSGISDEPMAPSVFLDLAFFSVPLAVKDAVPPADLQGLAEDPRVELLAVTHHSAELGRTSRAVVEDHSGPLARPLIHELVAKPTLPDADHVVLDLQVVLQLPSREPPLALERREHSIAFATAPRARRPIALSAPLPERPGRALLLLLTPYLVRDQRDLREIFVCKMADRKRVASRRDR